MLHLISTGIGYNLYGLSVHRVKAQQKYHAQKNKEIQGKESENIVDSLGFQRFTLKLGFGNIAGVDQLSDIDECALHRNDDTHPYPQRCQSFLIFQEYIFCFCCS